MSNTITKKVTVQFPSIGELPAEGVKVIASVCRIYKLHHTFIFKGNKWLWKRPSRWVPSEAPYAWHYPIVLTPEDIQG